MSYEDDEYFLPLEDQRVFGAGIKRTRVKFVPSSETHSSVSAPATTSSTPAPTATDSRARGSSLGDRYLSIVLSKSATSSLSPVLPADAAAAATGTDTITASSTISNSSLICDICNLPLSEPPPASISSNNSPAPYPPHPHESSLVHQASLPHSHPPSAIDRTRRGYKYLSSYGWDPDSRTGLGPTGSGIRVPLRPQAKHDTVGLGVDVNSGSDGEGGEKERKRRKKLKMKSEGAKVVKTLSAKQVRKKEEEGRKKAEKLRDMFYRSEELDKYLGGG